MQEVHLANLLTFTRDGEWGKAEPTEGYSPAMVVRGTDFERVRAGNLDTLPLRYIRSDILARKAVAAGDTLIETAGGTKDQPTGRSVFIPASVVAAADLPLVCASFARFLRPDPDRVDPQFLFWKLQDEYHSRRMMPYHVQHTGVARFQYTQFAENYPFSMPPLPEQRAIAATLGALDDKIELNRKMNATLEAMARALFRDWFVDFGPTRAKMEARPPYLSPDLWSLFPDRLDAEGKPEEWEVRPVGDFAELKGGKQLEKEHIAEAGPVPVFGGAGVMGYTTNHNADGFVISVGRVGAYCGQFFSHRGKAWINNNASLIRPKADVSGEWLLIALRHIDMDVIKKGAAQPFVSNGDIAKVGIIWPGDTIVGAFSDALVSLMRKAEANERESRTLAQTRDLLLPRLMSGELRVAEVERLAANSV